MSKSTGVVKELLNIDIDIVIEGWEEKWIGIIKFVIASARKPSRRVGGDQVFDARLVDYIDT